MPGWDSGAGALEESVLLPSRFSDSDTQMSITVQPTLRVRTVYQFWVSLFNVSDVTTVSGLFCRYLVESMSGPSTTHHGELYRDISVQCVDGGPGGICPRVRDIRSIVQRQ